MITSKEGPSSSALVERQVEDLCGVGSNPSSGTKQNTEFVPIEQVLGTVPRNWGRQALVVRNQSCCNWCPFTWSRRRKQWCCPYGGPFIFVEA